MNTKSTLREWRLDDLALLVKYADNPKIANNMRDNFPFPYTKKDGKEFIKRVSNAKGYKVLAITISDEVVGSIGLFPQSDIHRKNAEIGYFLAEPFWGNGITVEAVKQMVEYGFNHFDIDRIFGVPFGSNKASQRVIEKAGFVLEGRFDKTIFKNGEYHDELIYAIRR